MDTAIIIHYLWFKDYGCFHNQGFNLSSKYEFSYDPNYGEYGKINCNNNKDEYIDDFFGDSIDLTAIVGQNGTGKTTLLRFIQGLRKGNLINTECVIVCEKNSEFWAGRYFKEKEYYINCAPLKIKGCKNIELEIKKNESSRFPFSNDIRFIYLTEMFNMNQYASSIGGGDDLSFASILYDQTENGEEEKHVSNPVVRYIHRMTEWQLAFLSNGRRYVEHFKIHFPSYLYINLSYDNEAFTNLYVRIKGNEYNVIQNNSDIIEKASNSQNEKLKSEARAYLQSFLNIDILKTKSLLDEYAMAIFMNIITSLQFVISMTKDEGDQLYRLIETTAKKTKSKKTWDVVYDLLNAIKENNLNYTNQINNRGEKVSTDYISIDADRYIGFMDYICLFLSKKTNYLINPNQPYTLMLSTTNLEIIYDFFKNYKRTIHIVDFIAFSWGLSSGENLLLNQFGKIMHILKANYQHSYYLPEDVNSTRHVKNTIILLDEVEVAFHPEWQRIYFDAFLEFIKKNISAQGTHVQIVLATHSPIILSDIPKQNTVFLRREHDKNKTTADDNKETFAANIFSLYQNAFFLDEAGIGALQRRNFVN